MLDAGVIDVFAKFLTNASLDNLIKETLWGVSNLAADRPETIKLLIEHPILHNVLDCLKSKTKSDVVIASFNVFANILMCGKMD